MINRYDLLKKLNTSIHENPVTTLLGPRQCGKTTIAKTITTPYPVHYYDLENTADRSGLANPLTALGNLDGLVILDYGRAFPWTDLELKHLYIIHPGVRSYLIDANISALSISNLIPTLNDIRKFPEN